MLPGRPGHPGHPMSGLNDVHPHRTAAKLLCLEFFWYFFTKHFSLASYFPIGLKPRSSFGLDLSNALASKDTAAYAACVLVGGESLASKDEPNAAMSEKS